MKQLMNEQAYASEGFEEEDDEHKTGEDKKPSVTIPLKRTGRTAKHKKRKIAKGKVMGFIRLITDLESNTSWSNRVSEGKITATEDTGA